MNEETPKMGNEGADPRTGEAAVPAADVKVWFVRDVLPLEAMLMRFLQRSWRNAADVTRYMLETSHFPVLIVH